MFIFHLFFREFNRPNFISILSSVGLCWSPNSPPNSVKLVRSIIYIDPLVEAEIMWWIALKYALWLIFLKCICEFMISLKKAPPASNSVYGREKCFWYNKIILSNHMCHCIAGYKHSLAHADEPGSTPGDDVLCFFVPFLFFCFFFCLVFVF